MQSSIVTETIVSPLGVRLYRYGCVWETREERIKRLAVLPSIPSTRREVWLIETLGEKLARVSRGLAIGGGSDGEDSDFDDDDEDDNGDNDEKAVPVYTSRQNLSMTETMVSPSGVRLYRYGCVWETREERIKRLAVMCTPPRSSRRREGHTQTSRESPRVFKTARARGAVPGYPYGDFEHFERGRQEGRNFDSILDPVPLRRTAFARGAPPPIYRLSKRAKQLVDN